jgi:hypothetical protein
MAWYDAWWTLMTAAPGNKPALTSWVPTFFGALKNLALEHLARSDITTNNADTSYHGLMPKLTGVITHWMRADGSWAPVVITEAWETDTPARDWDVMTPAGMGGDGADPLKERLDNGFERFFLLFGYESAQYACAAIVLPENYVSGSLTATVRWETESDTIGTCVLKIYGELMADGDLSAVALTSPIATITDTSNGAAKINVSPITAMSPAGTGKYLIMRITRDYGTDTIEDDVKMLGITIAGTKVTTS